MARARAELACARGQPDQALQIVERLIETAANVERATDRVIPHLWHLRAEALAALGRAEEAEATWLAADAAARVWGLWPSVWRMQVRLGRLYQSQDRRKLATAAFAEARRVVEQLAANIPDAALRDEFLRYAHDRLPLLQPPSPRQAAKQEFGGLTVREREVAALIAQGKSNRAIAAKLVVSARTVTKHVENILTKSALDSRTGIALWAAARGLSEKSED